MNITVIDSCGCVSSPNAAFYAIVLLTGLNKVKSNKDKLLRINQVGSNIFFDNPFKLEAHVEIYEINGALCRSFYIVDNHLEIAHQLKNKGMYVIKISVGGLTGSVKFINL